MKRRCSPGIGAGETYIDVAIADFATGRIPRRYGGDVHLETALTLRATGRPTVCELASASGQPPRHG